MPRKRCAVRVCKSGTFKADVNNVKNNTRPPTLFMVPKSPTALARWEAALNQGLTSKDRVCELHFADADVKRSDDTLMPDGTIFSLPRQKYGLHKNAVPMDVVNQENTAPSTEHIHIDDNTNKLPEKVASHEINKELHTVDEIPLNRPQSDSTLLEKDKMVVTNRSCTKDNFLSDHQYHIGANKSSQYCYYNKKVAARFAKSLPNNNIPKISDNKQKQLDETYAEVIHVESRLNEEDFENEVTALEDVSPTLLDNKQDTLTIGNIIYYLQKNPLRRSWSWMKFPNKDTGITFTQIHCRNRKVRCHVDLQNDFSVVIQTGDEQISLEIEFEIKSIEHVLNLLETVENMKICIGTGFNQDSRSKSCNGIIPHNEDGKIDASKDRCSTCKQRRKYLRMRENCPKPTDLKIKYEKVRKEMDLLRRRCKYYEGRLTLKNKRLMMIKEMIKSYNKNHKRTSVSSEKKS